MSDSPMQSFSLNQTIEHRLALLDQSDFHEFDIDFNPTSFTGYRPRLSRIDLSESVAHRTPSRTDQSKFDISETRSHKIECDGTSIWVSGSALLCTCPDCSAPMTIRLWLGLADCWRCPTSIGLTEEQLEVAEQLAKEQALDAPAPSPLLPPPPPRPTGHIGLPVPPPVFQSPNIDAPVRISLSAARERELQQLTEGSVLANLLRNGFRNIPAWLISFLLHMVIILILALILLGDPAFFQPSITLSTFLDPADSEGGDIVLSDPDHALQDDLQRATMMDQGDAELRDVLKKANQDAQQLQTDPRPLAALPNISKVKENITTAKGDMMSFAARDPRVRSEIVRQQGGTTLSEAAVSRGLRWLASVQNHDGGWSLSNYRDHDDEDNDSDIMATSLALLPMLGAGQTHEYGRYKESVARGLAWILKNQKANGDLRAGIKDNQGMYAHGQATIVLCEAYALTGEAKFLEPAQRAIQFIEAAQHGKGGWRYQPGQVGDTSVFGWQMMALQSARASGTNLQVDVSTLKLADYFLDQVQADARFDNRRETRLPEGAAYSYQPNGNATPAMTAEAILCRMYLGWKKSDPRLDSAVKWLVKDHLPSRSDRNLYYWYYGTQVMHHYGGEPWETWNEQVRGLLIASQETRGKYPGSWDPHDYEWGRRGGRIYTTSLAVCTLEVYYRHLPIFHQIELDQ
ncbi:MAG: prenyltransferase/squalene oxidase repeat-containing protein [Planctomycetota bacterium]